MMLECDYMYCIDPNAEIPIMRLDGSIGEFDVVMGSFFAKELYTLDSLGKKEIDIIINSTGGSVLDAMSIYGAMKMIKAKINTYCIGAAFSSASFIFLAGDTRCILDSAKIMVHNPYNPDGTIDAGLLELRDSIVRMLSTNSDIPYELISEMMDRNTFINAEEALQCGFATEIIRGTNKNISTIKNKADFTLQDEAKRIYNIGHLVMNNFVTELQEINKTNNMQAKPQATNKDEFMKFAKSLAEIKNTGSVTAVDKVKEGTLPVLDAKNEEDDDAEERREEYEGDDDSKDKVEMDDCNDDSSKMDDCNDDDKKEMEAISDDDDTMETVDSKETMDLKEEMNRLKNELKTFKEAKAKADRDAMNSKISELLNVFIRNGKIKNEKEVVDLWKTQLVEDYKKTGNFDNTTKLINGFKTNKVANKLEDKIDPKYKNGSFEKIQDRGKRIAADVKALWDKNQITKNNTTK